MSPNQWGPPTWTLFHTLAEKMKEEDFPTLMPQLIFYIRKICTALPCPECSQHATTFWTKIHIPGIKNKTDLKNMLCLFHNIVNKRKNKPLFNNESLSERYANLNTVNVYNNFVAVYQTNGNMNLIAESFQRKLILITFKKWIMSNLHNFI
jgi:hypothetical protein